MMSTKNVASLLKERTSVKCTVEEIAGKFVRENSDVLASIHPALHLQQAKTAQENSRALYNTTKGIVATVRPESKAAEVFRENPTQVGEGGTERCDKNANHSSIHDVEEAEAQFKNTLREYESTAKDKYRTGINPDGEHSIDQLSKIIDDSISHYRIKDPKGFWGRVSRAARTFSKNADAVEGWLGLLPTDNVYLSVVAAGLKIIVKAAIRMRNINDNVLDCLCRIPIILNGTQRVLRIFQHDEELQNQSRRLYMSLLEVLGHILEYLKQNEARKLVRAILKQDVFEADLEQEIKTAEMIRDMFNDQAQVCHMEAVNKQACLRSQDTVALQEQLEHIGYIVKASEAEERRVRGAIAEALIIVQMKCDELQGQYRQLASNVELSNKLLKLLISNSNAYDVAYTKHKRFDVADRTLESGVQCLQPIIDIARRDKQESFHQIRKLLLSKLKYDPDVIGVDVASNYVLGNDLPMRDQERSVFVMKSKPLEDWVLAESSTSLVVNGNAQYITRKSALSFVCARLIYTLDGLRGLGASFEVQRPEIVPIHFFCGQHDTKVKGWESPEGVMNSLLAQLLLQCKHLGIARVPKLGKVDSSDLCSIFSCFKTVFYELPLGVTVFCIVDDISVYLASHEKQARWLISSLLEFSREETSGRPRFKVLLTAQCWLRMSSKGLGDVEVLSVPQGLPSTGGFSGMRWDMTIGKQLAETLET
ncbi:hypothetical protein NUW58_g1450 [Xylaria curta]|uniref:Uncharacterized protein n=1 Tax=Xylaria curta TaxID=42375 RepID=A0ACC1PM79_9PEZI|nr:hypothetical protein NUW58_g1450 [Xylaria curta]